MRIAGPRTNATFLHAIAESERFASGIFDTHTIAREFTARFAGHSVPARAIRLGALALLRRRFEAQDGREWRLHESAASPFYHRDRFGLGGRRETAMHVLADGAPATVRLRWPDASADAGGDSGIVAVHGGESNFEEVIALEAVGDLMATEQGVYIFDASGVTLIAASDAQGAGDVVASGGGDIRAPMHGKLVALLAQAGEEVLRGQKLAIVEAMKMEHVLVAPRDGSVLELLAVAGQQVAQGALLIRLADRLVDRRSDSLGDRNADAPA